MTYSFNILCNVILRNPQRHLFVLCSLHHYLHLWSDPLSYIVYIYLMLTVKRATGNCSQNNTTGQNSKIEMNAQKGELTSPGYPGFFTGDIQCTWYVYVARTYSIDLEFIFFDFGNSRPCSAKEDASYLEVREGVHRDSRQLGLFCGHTTPEKISTIGSQMRVSFKASRYRSVKFKATYRAVRGEYGWYHGLRAHKRFTDFL